MAHEEPRERWSAPESWPQEPASTEETTEAWRPSAASMPPTSDAPFASEPLPDQSVPSSSIEPLLFQHFAAPSDEQRIPNFGHLLILGALVLVGLLVANWLLHVALRWHMFGISSVQKAITDIHYTLGGEVALYVFILIASLVIFPLIWHKGFFAGVQWNAATAFRLRWKLVSAAFACLLLAAASTLIAPGPTNAPIDKIFKAPGAAWPLFVFGVTIAPFFEELFFRGFLLPSMCTAVDWCGEKIAHRPPQPLGPNGHPRWSLGAMAVGSIATSIPFAMIHAAQIAHSLGPLVLLAGVSLVLCSVRLSTRSLASSVLVHACYNFTLFTIMIVGTHGFRHLDKL